MAIYIASAILLSSAYTANEARKSRQEAERDQRTMLAQQASDQAAMRLELSKQTAEYAKQGASLEQQAQTSWRWSARPKKCKMLPTKSVAKLQLPRHPHSELAPVVAADPFSQASAWMPSLVWAWISAAQA